MKAIAGNDLLLIQWICLRDMLLDYLNIYELYKILFAAVSDSRCLLIQSFYLLCSATSFLFCLLPVV